MISKESIKDLIKGALFCSLHEDPIQHNLVDNFPFLPTTYLTLAFFPTLVFPLGLRAKIIIG